MSYIPKTQQEREQKQRMDETARQQMKKKNPAPPKSLKKLVKIIRKIEKAG